MPVNDGGMAFPGLDYTSGYGPSLPIQTDNGLMFAEHQNGMTLRDYFACSVEASYADEMIGSPDRAAAFVDVATCDYEPKKHWPIVVAKLRYAVADAMLAERSKANE